MDKANLERLSGIADLVHEQTAARLKSAQEALASTRARRHALLLRPGEALVEGSSDAAIVMAQATWGNSVAAGLPALDKLIDEQEQKVSQLIDETRASFTKVKGLENLSDREKEEERVATEKREEQAQDLLIGLSRALKTLD